MRYVTTSLWTSLAVLSREFRRHGKFVICSVSVSSSMWVMRVDSTSFQESGCPKDAGIGLTHRPIYDESVFQSVNMIFTQRSFGSHIGIRIIERRQSFSSGLNGERKVHKPYSRVFTREPLLPNWSFRVLGLALRASNPPSITV